MLRIIPTKLANKESLTTKRTLTFIAITAAACGGYILFLAVAAPQQLAEATTAATNLVCNGCVGSSDIADNSIQSVDIRNGQVGSVDIGNGQVATFDIQDRTIVSADMVLGAIQVNPHRVSKDVTISPNAVGTASVDCSAGEFLTGGGFFGEGGSVDILRSYPADANTWTVVGVNEASGERILTPYALCIDPSQP